jgi:hypothetical protein
MQITRVVPGLPNGCTVVVRIPRQGRDSFEALDNDRLPCRDQNLLAFTDHRNVALWYVRGRTRGRLAVYRPR